VSNHDPLVTTTGGWSDAGYLSADANWDIHDPLIGRVSHSGALAPGAAYTATLDATLPGVKPGQYRVIVRTDLFDEVSEGPTGEGNNTTASPGALTVSVPELHLGVALDTTLSAGQARLFQVNVGQGQTLQIDLTTAAATASNEVFVRYG